METVKYVERDCTIEHEGRTFEAGGAIITDQHVIGYVSGMDESGLGVWSVIGNITSWDGKTVLGHVTSVKSWATPRSYVSSRMYQITAKIDGIFYTGRSGGNGMVWKGKRSARQS